MPDKTKQDNLPWKDCGKEFEDWFERYWSKMKPLGYKTEVKKIAAAGWDAALITRMSTITNEMIDNVKLQNAK